MKVFEKKERQKRINQLNISFECRKTTNNRTGNEMSRDVLNIKSVHFLETFELEALDLVLGNVKVS